MRKYLETQIDSARSDIQSLEIELAKLQARLETLLETLDQAPDEDGPKKKTRRRSLSPQWRAVLYFMLRDYHDGASYDDIHEITTRVGIDMKKENLRGHMGNYKTSGHVVSPRPGVFVVTSEGKKQAKAPDEESPEVAQASPEVPLDQHGQAVRQRRSWDLDDEIPF